MSLDGRVGREKHWE